MALAHLGVPFDIHAGGKDLIFPHHTNEIAQSVAAAGADLDPEGYAHYWMHNGFVEIDHEKMSKSLGNVFTIREVIDRFDAEVLRLALLGTHYRHTISYTESLLTEAEQRLVYLYETLGRAAEHAAGAEALAGSVLVDRVRGALDDDLNTPQALAALGEAFVEANTIADRRRKSADERARLAAFVRDVGRAGASLGLLQRAPAEALLAIRDRAAARLGIDPAWVEARLAARNSARRAKDYALGDAIRDELQARGIRVQDGPAGATWRIGWGPTRPWGAPSVSVAAAEGLVCRGERLARLSRAASLRPDAAPES